MQVKYVMIDEAFPVIFCESFRHDQMKHLGKITSAGFVHIAGDMVQTYGESLSLGLKPADRDARVISRYMENSPHGRY